MCKVTMSMDKETKATVRFREIEDTDPVIGVLYVPKRTLEIMGFDAEHPQDIEIDISLKKDQQGKADEAKVPATAQAPAPAPAPVKTRKTATKKIATGAATGKKKVGRPKKATAEQASA